MHGTGNLRARVGRYEVTRLLGQGAMGEVLLARDPMLDRDVAIKMLRGDLGLGEEMRAVLLQRMRHEAKAAARVSHPNIVTLHDMIDDPELGICLVFEYVQGSSLKDRIAAGALPAVEVARIAREVGGALSLAHRAGVLHRDIKPENIMLAEHGAKIADFGIARVPDSTLTRAGGLLGTPAYSAPECISGGGFSPLSDQFSLGATLYEAVSGLRAFPGEDAITVAARVGTEEPAPIAQRIGIGARVDQVLGRALSKDPTRRYATCEAFVEALAAALEVGTMLQGTTTLRGMPAEIGHSGWAGQKKTHVGIGALVIGVLIVAVVTSMMRPSTSLVPGGALVSAQSVPISASGFVVARPVPLPLRSRPTSPGSSEPAQHDSGSAENRDRDAQDDAQGIVDGSADRSASGADASLMMKR